VFLKLPRPEVVDVMALAGFDFVIVDMEHAQISEVEARTLILACEAADLPAVVRLPDATPGLVNRLLEAGAAGIQMPKLRTASEAKRLRDMTRFPPEGTRSIGLANRQAGYGTGPVQSHVRAANDRTIAVGMFETKDIGESLDDVLQHVDVGFIGPSDLSLEYGLPVEHLSVQAHIQRIEEASHRVGAKLGYAAKSPAEARELAKRGYRYIAVGTDVSMLFDQAKDVISSLQPARAAPELREARSARPQ
jgi:4-hydroxy-2-oxoheptanedioate aldolase